MKKMKHERCKKSKKQKDAAQNPKIGEDFLTFLPSEIIINILSSRLPIRTTMSCTAVCKPWLDLLRTPEFVKSHISKSVPGLAVFLEGEYAKPYKVFEYVDELSNPKRRVPRWNMTLNFNLPIDKPPYSSVDGLLFLCTRGMMSREIFKSGIFRQEFIRWPRDLFICNPITREYIKLPCPLEFSSSKSKVHMDTFGFGVSRTTGQYKLVRVFHEWILNKRLVLAELVEPKFQVYNVGSGLWSGIACVGPFKYEGNAKGAFLSGNIHWLVRDMYGSSVWISCFDLETEIFSTFSPPPCRRDDREECLNVSTLRDCLCMCDNTAYDEIVIWLMRDYGDDKSWTKEFVIRKKDLDYNEGLMCPIKAFQNGDILMALEYSKPLTLYFSSKTKTFRHVDLFGLQSCFCIRTVSYAPSFLPLKTLAVDNVSSF
ncbi:F-box protein CPR1-like [Salvia miltiorrhiza]|uniref:F-box protein CPR1-like n=1 Tax=Salvia miltiorrhiza TaxID=226208 RepID=UPI0025AC074D|nr:F-box protein CPR1-like [Salvia miltiorrhiza]